MKYQNLSLFEKHIATSGVDAHHLYLILMGDDRERSDCLSALTQRLLAKDCRLEKFTPDDPLSSILDALQSPSLFGGEAVVVCDCCEQFKKPQVETLTEFLNTVSFPGYFLLGAHGKTPLSKVADARGIVLDTSEEKPWDKEKRLSHFAIERAKQSGKWLSSDAAALLLEKLGTDIALLSSEIDKLICYVGDHPTIERSDIFLIASSQFSHTLWEMAEAIVWEGKKVFDADAFPALIYALRSQLQIGLKMATLIEEKAPESAWSAHFPKMWPRTLEKRREESRKKGSPFFQKGLDSLYQIELLSRSGSTQTTVFLDLFFIQMSTYGRR